MLNENATTLGEMVDVENRDKIVSFCNSGCCAGRMASSRGRAIGIGKIKECPICGTKINFQSMCTPREIERYKIKYGKEFKK